MSEGSAPRGVQGHTQVATAGRHAVVIGGGIAGLLAARAVCPFYAEVTVLERDRLDADALELLRGGRAHDRGGVPQYAHTHLLLAGGVDAIESLVPGFTDDLVALGAHAGDFGTSAALSAGPVRVARGSFGLRCVSGGRDLQERVLRRRIIGSCGVSLRSGATVQELLFDPSRRSVDGVRVTTAQGREETLPADLVIDASGRGSRTPADLAAHGYAPPREDVQRIDLRSTTRRFRMPDTLDPRQQPLLAIVQAGTTGDHRAGTALHVRDREWVVGISDYGPVHPPRDLEGFRAFARALPRPEIADLLAVAEPLDAGVYYRTTTNVRRYYEDLDRMPEGLVVLGDALASYDPGFGQGMSVAALQCRSLQSCLRQYQKRPAGAAEPLARLFQPRAAGDLAESWANVTRRHRELTGTPEGRVATIIGRYIESLVIGAGDAPELSAAFLRFAHLTRPLSSLFTPGVALRVARSQARRPRRSAREGLSGDSSPSSLSPGRPGSPGPDTPSRGAGRTTNRIDKPPHGQSRNHPSRPSKATATPSRTE